VCRRKNAGGVLELKIAANPAHVGFAAICYIIGNFVPYDIKPSGGCALCAQRKWLLTQPRSGARVRQAGLFI